MSIQYVIRPIQVEEFSTDYINQQIAVAIPSLPSRRKHYRDVDLLTYLRQLKIDAKINVIVIRSRLS